MSCVSKNTSKPPSMFVPRLKDYHPHTHVPPSSLLREVIKLVDPFTHRSCIKPLLLAFLHPPISIFVPAEPKIITIRLMAAALMQ
jgi:hypothetical protein